MPRNYRYKHWDYKGKGVYMITMNIDGRKPLLGELQGGTDAVWVNYSLLGKAVSEEIEKCFANYPQIQICAKQLMPDHLHFVVWVKDLLPISLGEIIRKLKIGCTYSYWEIVLHLNVQSKDATTLHMNVQSKDATSLHMNVQNENATNSNRGNRPSLFEPGFHDRIMLHNWQLRRMIDYVRDNPRRLALKRANPQLFRLHRQVQMAGFESTTLGNRFLLDFPMKGIIQCSRRLSQTEIDQKKEQCFEEAERGTVFISAGISEGEKQICRALREAGYPLIILLKDGFPKETDPHYKYFKPQGVYFETCAAGWLLLIEPREELYENKQIEQQVYAKAGVLSNDSMRYRFLALNELARQIGNY